MREDNLVDIAQERDRREERKLEKAVLAWDDLDAQELMAATLDVLAGRDPDVGDLWTLATAYRTDKSRAHLPEGTCAAGAARLLLGHHDGLALLLEGFELSGYDPFWLRFARYTIQRSDLPEERKRAEIAEFEREFREGFDKGSTFTISSDDWDRDPRTYLRSCAYHCLERQDYLAAERMFSRAREHLLRSRNDPSALLAKATYHHLMGDLKWCEEILLAVKDEPQDPEVVELAVSILGHEQHRTDATIACAQAIIPIATRLFWRDPKAMAFIRYLNSTHLDGSEDRIEHERHRARFAQR